MFVAIFDGVGATYIQITSCFSPLADSHQYMKDVREKFIPLRVYFKG